MTEPAHSTQRTSFLFGILRLVLTAAALFLLGPITLTSAPQIGLDPSYQLGLLHALQAKLTFGTEYIFPFGPLAFTMTRIVPAGWRAAIVLADFTFIAALAHLICVIGGGSRSYFKIAILFLATAVITPSLYSYDSALVWFGLMGFYTARYLQCGKISALIAACAISIYLFYLKLNVGLTAPVLMVVLLIYLASTRRAPRYLALLATYVAAVFLCAALLHVDLWPYISTGWHLANGFNDAMGLDPFVMKHAWWLYLALSVLAGFLLIVFCNLRTVLLDRILLPCAIFNFIFLYLLFKQSFVRADNHALIFANIAPLSFVPLYLISTNNLRRWMAGLISCTVLISAGYNYALFTPRTFVAHCDNWRNYAAQLIFEENIQAAIPPDEALPNDILARIGNATVDVFPWEVSYAFFNNLNYAPRPIFQSYQAYDATLDEINAAYFLSGRAPQFVVFSYEALDSRYWFADGTETNLALLERYDIALRSGDFLLLEKRAAPRSLKRRVILSGNLAFGRGLKLHKNTDLLIASYDIRYSAVGAVRRLLYQPPQLTLQFTLQNGRRSYRGIKPLLQGGILVNKLVPDLNSAELFFRGSAQSLPDVQSVRINSKAPWAFRGGVHYTITAVTVSDSTSTR